MSRRYSITEARDRFTALLREIENEPAVEITRRTLACAGTSLADRHRQPHPFADGQIAAIARSNGLTLVTFNTQDFELFQDIQLKDWRPPD